MFDSTSEQKENRRSSFQARNEVENEPTGNQNSFRQEVINYDIERVPDMLEDKQNQIEQILSKINCELKCLGIKPINGLCSCSSSQTDDIIQVIQNLINLRDKEKEKTQGFMRQFNRSQTECRAKQQRLQQLQGHNDQIMRNKDYLQQKIKNLLRDFKQKQDKILKEREYFLKEKKGWETQSHAIGIEFKNKQNKIHDLEKRLQKFIEKGEKIQFKNIFELMDQGKRISKSAYQMETVCMIEKDMEAHRAYLANNNTVFWELIKEVLLRLKNLMHTLHETDSELFLNQNTINIPQQHSQIYIKTIRKYLEKIEKRLSETPILSCHKSIKGETEEVNDLYESLQKMRGYYDKWQQLFLTQKKIFRNKIHFTERINRIKNDDLHHIYEMMAQQPNVSLYEECAKRVDELKCSNPESDAIFIDKVKFLMQESDLMNLVDRKMDQCLLDRE